MLIEPAAVDRWHGEGGSRSWRGHLRRPPGRPRIDPACRDLIRRMGGRELSLGSAADPRRIAEARNHHFRTHRLALSERPPDDPVTNLADIRREPLWWPDILADDVRGFGRRGDRRRPV